MGATSAIEIRLRPFDCQVPERVASDLARAGLVPTASGCEVVVFERSAAELATSLAAGAIAVALDDKVQRESVVPLLRAGALDVLDASAADWAERVRALLERRAEVDALMASPMVRDNVAGHSARWHGAVRQAVGLSQRDASVLLLGDTGTGKELLARLIHGLDPRRHKSELIVLDCTTLVAELSGSELFGHERGAFTGALTAREGVIAQAENGTLFLDEVGELPLGLQAQLLRVIQERAYRRVGADSWRTASFRLICATHRDLEVEVQRGRFRADLYYRLAASVVKLPALRERRGDVLPLARFFLHELSRGRATGFDALVEDHLVRREFPGNVRELKQLVGRAYHRWTGVGPVGYAALPEDEWGASELDLEAELEPLIRKALAARLGLKDIGRISQDLAVKIAIEDAGGNLQKAASQLAVTDRTLQLRRASKLEA
jgi:transcriptional regulator with GAF, ATPase, and Fis domain